MILQGELWFKLRILGSEVIKCKFQRIGNEKNAKIKIRRGEIRLGYIKSVTVLAHRCVLAATGQSWWDPNLSFNVANPR